MSAFVVDKAHIDALLTAGLARFYHYPPLRWHWPEIGPEDQEAAYQRGEPWGPGSVRLTEERKRELTKETAGRVGAMLWAENRRSVNHRYDQDEREEVYTYERFPPGPDRRLECVAVLKAIDCYEYQSCEHPEWRRSEALAFCEALRRRCIARLPGYDEAPWEITSRTVFSHPRPVP